MCKLKSTSSNYKYNTRTAQMHKNKTPNKQNKIIWLQELLGPKP